MVGNKRLIYLGIFLILLLNRVSAETFSEQGSIYDNGDEYWDSNELDFIKYSLKANEEFKIEFQSTGELELFLCDCATEQNINSIFVNLGNDIIPDNLYLWIDSYSVTTGSYTPSTDISLNIAIFTVTDTGSISYTILTNSPSNNYLARMEQSDTTVDGTINIGPTILIIIAIVVAGLILYYFYDQNVKKRTRHQIQNSTYYSRNSYGYSPPISPKKEYIPEPIKIKAVFCIECGTKGITNFCTNCGEKLL